MGTAGEYSKQTNKMFFNSAMAECLPISCDEASTVELTRTLQAAYQYLTRCSESEYGLQMSIALDSQFNNSLSLGVITVGEFPSNMPLWQVEAWKYNILPKLKDQLGCALTLENFTQMLALKFLHGVSLQTDFNLAQMQQRWAQSILNYGLLSPDCWRFLFFRTKDFAADTDCLGVALAGLYACGAINDCMLARGAFELLSSASVREVSDADNEASVNERQDSLVKGVLKTYFEDQTFVLYQQHSERANERSQAKFRGCKHDLVAVVNAMLPILQTLQVGMWELDNLIQLQEYAENLSHTDNTTISEILCANWGYIANHLNQIEKGGTRYYPYSETFLCCLSELFLYCPQQTAAAISASVFKAKVAYFLATVNIPENPLHQNPLRLAQLVIAADNYNTIYPQMPLDPQSILAAKQLLLSQVRQDGSWAPFPYFTLGTNHQVFFGSAVITTVFAIRALEGSNAVNNKQALDLKGNLEGI
ncbi:hypothetical protein [Calothrix sp. UHCC 0171]|uniref:hypothetical protein n=1 Tax=Calothrix sp. UHCC 0171 TaxID=3110245 RepID=UPI002B1EB8DF|nr:hypothetical protein [Calothrix sp. UHCC 0171]MEA5574651.1 hypothetical protein [Calothrix sp. UHCC 0171]